MAGCLRLQTGALGSIRSVQKHGFEYRDRPQLCTEARPGSSRGLSRTAVPTRKERAVPTTERGLSPVLVQALDSVSREISDQIYMPLT
jgi:hypothetical protein